MVFSWCLTVWTWSETSVGTNCRLHATLAWCGVEGRLRWKTLTSSVPFLQPTEDDIEEFLTLWCACHTAVPEGDGNDISYQASSPGRCCVHVETWQVMGPQKSWCHCWPPDHTCLSPCLKLSPVRGHHVQRSSELLWGSHSPHTPKMPQKAGRGWLLEQGSVAGYNQ